ncbi:MAG: OmpH family outer membrane protein [bacterium]|jgi:outer membrane protein
MRWRPLLLTLGVLLIALPALAFKVGVVDLNRALNESEEGIRSKNLLEAQGRQKQEELRLQEEELQKLAADLRNNPLLTEQARQQKEQELRQKQQTLQGQLRQFEQQLRGEERNLTMQIFAELKNVIRTISLNGEFDLVLERNAAQQVILFSKEEPPDLTQQVIDRYNQLKQAPKAQ